MVDFPENSQLYDVSVSISRSFKHNRKRIICSIQDLPTSVLVDIILSRLPIESTFNCKLVCKEWYKLITDPYFVKGILASPPLVSILLSFGYVFSYLLKLKSPCDCIPYVNKAICIRNKIKPNNKVVIIGCCNGLLCLLHDRYNDDHGLYISNPILGECVKIMPPSSKRIHGFAYGFGYSTATSEFKILRIARKKYVRQPLKSRAEVYTVGVDHYWRDIGEAPFPYFRKICGVTLNGGLHWIEEGEAGGEVHLFSFDIKEEKVQAVPSPRNLSGIFMMELGVLKNCLCIFDSNWCNYFDIWWMKDYGVGESWTRDRILKDWVPRDLQSPITIWRDGEILMATRQGGLFSYHPKEKKTTQVKVSSDMVGSGFCDAILYAPNFSSLKSVMGEHMQKISVRSES